MLLALEPYQLNEEARKHGIGEDQLWIRASRLAEKLLPQVQNGLPRAHILRQWLRTLPGEWRANMHSKLGEDAKLPGQAPEFCNAVLMQHVEEVSLKHPFFRCN